MTPKSVSVWSNPLFLIAFAWAAISGAQVALGLFGVATFFGIGAILFGLKAHSVALKGE